MNIDELVAAFAALPGATVGRGPLHPLTPEPALADRLSEYFGAEYPGLDRDPSYAEFMWKYAGLSRIDDNQDQVFEVLGFGPGTTDIDTDLDEEMVDEDGVFVFAECIVKGDIVEGPVDAYTVVFGFDLTGERRAGVYRYTTTTQVPDSQWVWHAPDFQAFLSEAIANRGFWPRPTTA
jgi:hypothetical protein